MLRTKTVSRGTVDNSHSLGIVLNHTVPPCHSLKLVIAEEVLRKYKEPLKVWWSGMVAEYEGTRVLEEWTLNHCEALVW